MICYHKKCPLQNYPSCFNFESTVKSLLGFETEIITITNKALHYIDNIGQFYCSIQIYVGVQNTTENNNALKICLFHKYFYYKTLQIVILKIKAFYLYI